MTNEDEVCAIDGYVSVQENPETSIKNDKNILHMKTSQH